MFLLLTVGCASLLTIEISESTQLTIEQGTVLETVLADFGFGDFVSMDLTESEELVNQGVEPGDIELVTLTVLELEVIEPNSADLSFFEKMTFFVVSETMTLETDVTARRPDQDTLIEARFTIEVQATIQGAKNQLDRKLGY